MELTIVIGGAQHAISFTDGELAMRCTASATALVTVCASAAQAQQAGPYDAALADGTTVHFDVDRNPVTHYPRVTFIRITFLVPCAALPTPVEPTTWSWSPDVDLNREGMVLRYTSADHSFFLAYIIKRLANSEIVGPARFVNTVIAPAGGGGFHRTMCNRRQGQRLELIHSGARAP